MNDLTTTIKNQHVAGVIGTRDYSSTVGIDNITTNNNDNNNTKDLECDTAAENDDHYQPCFSQQPPQYRDTKKSNYRSSRVPYIRSDENNTAYTNPSSSKIIPGDTIDQPTKHQYHDVNQAPIHPVPQKSQRSIHSNDQEMKRLNIDDIVSSTTISTSAATATTATTATTSRSAKTVGNRNNGNHPKYDERHYIEDNNHESYNSKSNSDGMYFGFVPKTKKDFLTAPNNSHYDPYEMNEPHNTKLPPNHRPESSHPPQQPVKQKSFRFPPSHIDSLTVAVSTGSTAASTTVASMPDSSEIRASVTATAITSKEHDELDCTCISKNSNSSCSISKQSITDNNNTSKSESISIGSKVYEDIYFVADEEYEDQEEYYEDYDEYTQNEGLQEEGNEQILVEQNSNEENWNIMEEDHKSEVDDFDDCQDSGPNDDCNGNQLQGQHHPFHDEHGVQDNNYNGGQQQAQDPNMHESRRNHFLNRHSYRSINSSGDTGRLHNNDFCHSDPSRHSPRHSPKQQKHQHYLTTTSPPPPPLPPPPLYHHSHNHDEQRQQTFKHHQQQNNDIVENYDKNVDNHDDDDEDVESHEHVDHYDNDVESHDHFENNDDFESHDHVENHDHFENNDDFESHDHVENHNHVENHHDRRNNCHFDQYSDSITTNNNNNNSHSHSRTHNNNSHSWGSGEHFDNNCRSTPLRVVEEEDNFTLYGLKDSYYNTRYQNSPPNKQNVERQNVISHGRLNHDDYSHRHDDNVDSNVQKQQLRPTTVNSSDYFDNSNYTINRNIPNNNHADEGLYHSSHHSQDHHKYHVNIDADSYYQDEEDDDGVDINMNHEDNLYQSSFTQDEGDNHTPSASTSGGVGPVILMIVPEEEEEEILDELDSEHIDDHEFEKNKIQMNNYQQSAQDIGLFDKTVENEDSTIDDVIDGLDMEYSTYYQHHERIHHNWSTLEDALYVECMMEKTTQSATTTSTTTDGTNSSPTNYNVREQKRQCRGPIYIDLTNLVPKHLQKSFAHWIQSQIRSNNKTYGNVNDSQQRQLDTSVQQPIDDTEMNHKSYKEMERNKDSPFVNLHLPTTRIYPSHDQVETAELFQEAAGRTPTTVLVPDDTVNDDLEDILQKRHEASEIDNVDISDKNYVANVSGFHERTPFVSQLSPTAILPTSLRSSNYDARKIGDSVILNPTAITTRLPGVSQHYHSNSSTDNNSGRSPDVDPATAKVYSNLVAQQRIILAARDAAGAAERRTMSLSHVQSQQESDTTKLGTPAIKNISPIVSPTSPTVTTPTSLLHSNHPCTTASALEAMITSAANGPLRRLASLRSIGDSSARSSRSQGSQQSSSSDVGSGNGSQHKSQQHLHNSPSFAPGSDRITVSERNYHNSYTSTNSTYSNINNAIVSNGKWTGKGNNANDFDSNHNMYDSSLVNRSDQHSHVLLANRSSVDQSRTITYNSTYNGNSNSNSRNVHHGLSGNDIQRDNQPNTHNGLRNFENKQNNYITSQGQFNGDRVGSTSRYNNDGGISSSNYNHNNRNNSLLSLYKYHDEVVPPTTVHPQREEPRLESASRNSAPNMLRSNATVSSQATTNTLSTTFSGSSTSPLMQIEVVPGVFERLRGAQETSIAIENNRVAYSTCMACLSELMCVIDAQYVLCPECKVISSLTNDDYNNNYNNGISRNSYITPIGRIGGGVGLGVLVQSSNNNFTNHHNNNNRNNNNTYTNSYYPSTSTNISRSSSSTTNPRYNMDRGTRGMINVSEYYSNSMNRS